MSRFFNPDNPVMEFIAKIFDLVILNLIFIFSCVPIIIQEDGMTFRDMTGSTRSTISAMFVGH